LNIKILIKLVRNYNFVRINIYTACVEPLNMQFARQITYLVDRNCQIFCIKIFHSCSLFIQIIKLKRATSKSATWTSERG